MHPLTDEATAPNRRRAVTSDAALGVPVTAVARYFSADLAALLCAGCSGRRRGRRARLPRSSARR